MMDLDGFAVELREQVLAAREVEEQEDFAENAFVARFLSHLADAGEIDDAEVVHYRAQGAKLNAYVLDVDAESLDLVVGIYTGQVPPPTVDKSQVEQAFRQLSTFLQRARKGLHQRLEESGAAFDAAFAIREALRVADTVSRIRLFLITDGIVRTRNPDEIIQGVSKREDELEGFEVSHHIWDMERLFRWYTSGHAREEIQVDLVEMLGKPLECLPMTDMNEADHETFLAFIPGSLLADIYGRFGARLLERNVRSFLQARGAVNKGIRKTLLEEPQRFLAYNNGLTATAAQVEIVRTTDGQYAIKRLRDFQIVNGGQTTASIFHCARKDQADLSSVLVQLKLSLVKDMTRIDDIVARISQFANSQNKVNVADFSANDPFHRRIEALSRTLWAPAKAGSQRQTRWFYERARGQYADDRGRAGTSAKIREFELINPRSQMFTKTDLAKFENTWMQKPQWVSKGAQKNFASFTLELSRKGAYEPDEQYFQWLIAKASLFRRAENLIQAQEYGGYRANIVTYTLALVSHATSQRLSLAEIWRTQEVSAALEKLIVVVSERVQAVITAPPGGRNITEWCKSDACWEAVRAIELALPRGLSLAAPSRDVGGSRKQDLSSPDESESKLIDAAANIPAATWFELSSWAKDTHNLALWQRALVYSLGKLAGQGRRPSVKQARQGLIALQAGRDLGFRPTTNDSD
jgi:hypothetical protein